MRQIVDRISAILALYSFEQPEWGVSAIGTRLGLPKSTVSELLASLAAQGFVERTPRGRYRLGWRLFELNHVLLESKPLVREARREMQELVERHGESSHLMVLDRHQAVIVEKLQATLATQILMSRVGLRLPAHCSACGKLLLAWRPWGEVAQMFDQVELVAFTPATLTDLPALAAELRLIREQGVAFDHEEIVPGLSCVAATIRDGAGEPVAGISVSIPTYRFVGGEETYVSIIANSAYRISCRLGFTGPPPDPAELERAAAARPRVTDARSRP